MNRTESTSPQDSYVLEVGVIIGGVLSEPPFRHDRRIGESLDQTRGRRRLEERTADYWLPSLMTKHVHEP